MLQAAGQGDHKRLAALLLAIIIGSMFVNVTPSDAAQESPEQPWNQGWIDRLGGFAGKNVSDRPRKCKCGRDSPSRAGRCRIGASVPYLGHR
jgi:hypothetical protein